MSELRSVADALAAESLSEMPDARVEEDFVELHRAVERLERSDSGGSPRSTGAGCTNVMGTCLPRRGS
jgi:hypothetical protein